MGHTRLMAGFFKRYLLIEHVAGNHPCARRVMAADPASFSAAPIHKMPGGDAKPGLLCFNGHHVFCRLHGSFGHCVFHTNLWDRHMLNHFPTCRRHLLGRVGKILSSQISCLEPPTLTTTDSTCILPQTWVVRCILQVQCLGCTAFTHETARELVERLPLALRSTGVRMNTSSYLQSSTA